MATVEIEIGDDGKVSVGMCPPSEEAAEPKEHLKPAKSLDDALAQARTLLQHVAPAVSAKPPTMQEGMQKAMFGAKKA